MAGSAQAMSQATEKGDKGEEETRATEGQKGEQMS